MWGNGPNSVDAVRGLVVVAVEADPKTDPRRVVFFRSNGDYVADVKVGALPDMVTFTPEGDHVLVANEAEASGYGNAYAANPEGSVSVISTRNVGRRGVIAVRTVGRVGGRTYAFVGLERIGGLVVSTSALPRPRSSCGG